MDTAEPNVAAFTTGSVESGHGEPSSGNGIGPPDIDESFGYITGDGYVDWAGYGKARLALLDTSKNWGVGQDMG